MKGANSMTNLTVNVKRTNQKVHFEGVSVNNPNISIPFDFTPPLGDGCGFAGLELLLMSFTGCVSTAVVFLLQRMDKHIVSYSASAEGVRNEHPLSLKEICLTIQIKSEDITDEDMKNVIKQAENVSPVWQAIKNNVNAKVTYVLI
jgi:uncharacterized OsmC-like protein